MKIAEEDMHAIHTGLYTKKAKEVLRSVFGQLSDGWGKDNPRNDKWWKFGDASQAEDGEVLIYVFKHSGKCDYDKWTANGFYGMSDEEVKSWMARMVKKTMQMELRDSKAANGWKRDNMSFKTCYLNYHEDISVAEVYCMYELLLGRLVGITKYDAGVISAVMGSKRPEEEAKREHDRRVLKHDLDAEYNDKIKAVKLEEKLAVDKLAAKIKEIENEYKVKRDEIWREHYKKVQDAGLGDMM